jgi:hypothetical protein
MAGLGRFDLARRYSMDDSERSYGYSRDIYHGRQGTGGQYGVPYRSYGFGPYYPDQPHWERSYEYGPEAGGMGDTGDADLSPEEAAVHLEEEDRREGWFDSPRYAAGAARDTSQDSESFTWFAPGPHTGRGPRGYRRADSRILEEVCQRLSDDGNVDASEISVHVLDGEVTLEGTVPSRRMKRLAEGDAEVVRGVLDVHNRLRVAHGEQEGKS